MGQRLGEEISISDREPEPLSETLGPLHDPCLTSCGVARLGGWGFQVLRSSMYSTASPTVRIFSASSSEISVPNSSSNDMMSSTRSSESAFRSSSKEAFDV